MAEANYISREGADVLQAELDHLFRVERPRVVNNVAAAAAEGDRSENAEYIYGKKRLRQIDKRIGFLSRRIDKIEVVPPPKQFDKIVILSWIVVETPDGDERTFRLVGQDETDAKIGLISWRSPVGRALLGKREGDTVNVQTPGGHAEYEIVGIHAERP